MTGVANYEWKSNDGLIALSGAEIGGSCEVSYQRDFENISGSNEMGYRLVRLRRGQDAVHDGIIWNFKAQQQTGSNFVTILYFDKGPTSFRLMFIDTLAKKNAKLYNSIIDQVGAWK